LLSNREHELARELMEPELAIGPFFAQRQESRHAAGTGECDAAMVLRFGSWPNCGALPTASLAAICRDDGSGHDYRRCYAKHETRDRLEWTLTLLTGGAVAHRPPQLDFLPIGTSALWDDENICSFRRRVKG
jgi:hypothetical protein